MRSRSCLGWILFQNVLAKTPYTLNVFEILLFEGRSKLPPITHPRPVGNSGGELWRLASNFVSILYSFRKDIAPISKILITLFSQIPAFTSPGVSIISRHWILGTCPVLMFSVWRSLVCFSKYNEIVLVE